MTRRSQQMFVLVVGIVSAALGCSGEEPESARLAAAVGCATDNECAVGSVCENGNCELAVCPDIYDPVCGTNGSTYGNACDARAEHVPVARPGVCEQLCGGIQYDPCPDQEVCELPAGQCDDVDLQGVCVERPEVCPEIFEPVCGCDALTYSNNCFRLMAGVQLDYLGECGA